MSVQSGMISEPPVNVNDSDHSAVTWLSIFFYSLCRSQGGKVQQRERERERTAQAELHWALLMFSTGTGRVLPAATKTTHTGRAKGFCSKWELFEKLLYNLGQFLKFKFFFLFLTRKWNLFSRSGIYSTQSSLHNQLAWLEVPGSD